MEFDATFYALVGLVIFLALMIYLKVPAVVNKSLDGRADKIRDELEEARRLREEAQSLLAEFQRKRKEAEKEAGEIIAPREAHRLLRGSQAENRRICNARRKKLAEQKIAQAETEAVNEVGGLPPSISLSQRPAIFLARRWTPRHPLTSSSHR